MSYVRLEWGGLAFVQDNQGNCLGGEVSKVICDTATILQGYFIDMKGTRALLFM